MPWRLFFVSVGIAEVAVAKGNEGRIKNHERGNEKYELRSKKEAAAKKRVRIRLAPTLPASVRCRPPCAVCRNRYGHSSACLAYERALIRLSLDRVIQLQILRVASQ